MEKKQILGTSLIIGLVTLIDLLILFKLQSSKLLLYFNLFAIFCLIIKKLVYDKFYEKHPSWFLDFLYFKYANIVMIIIYIILLTSGLVFFKSNKDIYKRSEIVVENKSAMKK